jgi:hypothetical protein
MGKSVVRAIYRFKFKLRSLIVRVLDLYAHRRERTYSLSKCAIDCYRLAVIKYVSFIVAVRRPSVFVRFSCCGCCCCSSSCSSSTSAPIAEMD